MAKRIIGALGASYKDPENPEVILDVEQGQQAELSTAEEERLEGLGVLVPEGQSLQQYLDAKMDLYRAERGDSDAARKLAEARSGGIVDLSATPTAAGGDVAKIAAEINDENMTVEETVALAEDDPAKAKTILEAEKVATGGEPRRGVEHRLNAIIEG
jgi:hypothetical protein